MLYELALTAGVFDQFPREVEAATGQALVQVLVGVRQNGLLANLHNGAWWEQVGKRASALPSAVRPLVIDLLRQLFDRGLIVDRDKWASRLPRSDMEWLDEALGSHARSSFHAIVTRLATARARVGSPECVVPLEGVLVSPLWNERKRTRRVARTADGFKQALGAILATSRSIALVDPHLVYRTSLHNLQFRDALSVIDSSAVPDDRHSRLHIVEIHARVAWDEAIPEDRYAGVARLIAPAMPRVVAACSERWLRVWRPRPGGKPFHNRRILTNHAGLSCPWGLDVHDAGGAGDDEWALLDYEDRVAISADFQRNTSPYELVVEVPW